MKLVITTQIYENYAWKEDGSLGVGTEAHWKPKGGNDYVVKNFRDTDKVTAVVMALRNRIEIDNDGFRENIVDWQVVEDDYLTQYEQDQLVIEGKITFPATELEW